MALAFLVWNAGALSTQWAGVWLGVGTAAILLSLAAALAYGPALREWLRPKGSGILWGVVAGAVMIGATYGLYGLMVKVAPALAVGTTQLYALFRTAPVPAQLVLLLPIILSEEVVRRGVTQEWATRRWGPIAGVVAAAAVYALAHLPTGQPLLAGIAFLCGLYWGAVRQATGSLVAPLLAHVLWDLTVMVAFPLVE